MWSNRFKPHIAMPRSEVVPAKPQPKKPKVKFVPTAQACEIILAYFAHNNYQDFNTWQQVSHSRIEVDFIDEKSSAKNFKCKVTLSFEDPEMPKYVNIGEGRGKKEAKKQALEKTISQIVWQNHIGLGFKDQNFMQKLPRRKREEEQAAQVQQETPGTLNQAELSAYLQEISRLLERDEFDRAADLLNFRALDLCTEQSKPPQRERPLALLPLPASHIDSQLSSNLLLKKQYGFGRLDASNLYEVYDKTALEWYYEEYRNKLPKSEQIDTFKPSHMLLDKFKESLNSELVDIVKPCQLDPAILSKSKQRRNDQKYADKLRKQLRKEPPVLKPPLSALIPLLNTIEPIKIDQQLQDAIIEETKRLPPVYNTTQIFSSQGLIPPIKFNPFELFPPVLTPIDTGAKDSLSAFQKLQSRNANELRLGEKKLSVTMAALARGFKIQVPKFSNDRTSQMASKMGNKVSISSKLLDSLYESVLYVDDYKFAVHVIEMIYANCTVRLEESNSTTSADPQYYAHCKNQIVCEFIEKLHHEISMFHMGLKKTSLEGLLTAKHNDQFLFTPKQQEYAIEVKLSKRINTNEFEEMLQIAPGEFGLLQSLHQENKTYICCFKECNPIKVVCPYLKLTEPALYRFFKLTNRKFYDKLSAAALNISRKNMNLLSKSNVHLVWHYPTCNRNYILQMVLDWVKNGNTVLVVSNDLEELYIDFAALGLRPQKATPQLDERQYSSSKPQVVCSTINGCASEAFKNATFTRVLICEANSHSQVMTLLPLAKGCKKVVLVGDPHLPGPIVMSPFAKSKGMGISLFGRLVKEGHQLSNYSNQSKLHPSISNWISTSFYSGELHCDQSLQMTPTVKGFPWPSFDNRICLIDVKGKEQFLNNSLINTKQGELAVHILASVSQAGFTQLSEVQILTAHDSQRQFILTLLHSIFQNSNDKKDKDSIKPEQIQPLCCLVDAQQNVSKDLVIFTACKTSEHLGALNDPIKINAFMSKAKRGLIVIGSLATLARGSPLWSELINWAAANGLIMNAI